MDRVKHSFDNFGLHPAAIAGDDEGVRRALNAGADINALDSAGRTAIMCAIAGEDWQNIDASDASFQTPERVNAIRLMLAHPDISLLTLNAPHSSMSGVIPLGMAAWLNLPCAVQLLLEDSADAVSVDGMDSHGATALMYATRDGSLDVVKLLLSHGARPDFRDCNHRTSIQFALAHPQILWLCETVLRRHRWRESKAADRTKLLSESETLLGLGHSALPLSDELEPPPLSIFIPETISRMTDTLISSIRSSDVSFIHSLLFSPALPSHSPPSLYPMSVPVLVNHADTKGWSPIHYCVAADCPSIDILDSLYLAGADIALFTAEEQHTPLHILAQSAHVTDQDQISSLYEFASHLIRDLRAPLSARDKDDETCIHIAAEHGTSLELLMVLINCDTSGVVRELRNSRGLTALEVAKPEFRIAFGEDAENMRSVSAMSTHTIRATQSFTSLVSFSEWNPIPAFQSDSESLCSPLDFDFASTAQQLIENLHDTSPEARHQNDIAYVDRMENLLSETSQLSKMVLGHFSSRILEATGEIESLRKNSERIDTLRNAVSHAASGKMAVRGLRPILPRKRNRDSEDSQLTAVSRESTDAPSTCVDSSSIHHISDVSGDKEEGERISVATQTNPLAVFNIAAGSISRSQSQSWSAWLDGMIYSDEASTYKAYLSSLWDIEQELAAHQESFESGEATSSTKHLLKKKRKIEEKLKDLDLDQKKAKKGTGRFKAWLKRIIVPETPSSKLEIVVDIDEEPNVGRQVKPPTFSLTSECDTIAPFDATIDHALRTSQVVLDTAQRDLKNIEESLLLADQFLDLARHSISRADRVMKRAMKKREALIAELRLSSQPSDDDALFMERDPASPVHLGFQLSLRPSLSSISSIYSTDSSVHSIAGTVMENNDEDIRIIRRFLLRKIEARTSGAWDEIDKVAGWLCILKEVVRGVKRRAYL